MNLVAKLQQGFSLLEVLISVVILAIGLLGIASLQVNMIRYNHSAQLRSIAIAQAESMLDRMRANYTGVKSGLYNSLSGIPSLPSCTNCTAAESALRDLNLWNTTNSKLLPSGQGTVTKNGNHYVVTVRWDNNRTGVTGLGCSGNEKVDLTCLTMEVRL
ncbi:pre-pilin leader sequence (pilV) (plasmid) [Legionella adelaidensis]|uniref:Pre-pilin leader sequence (PilV) n=1 Tax=Legionella adelaidensis TaxID=45056 RepID=A0A0W0R3B2_9GAMM|nr:type IV pilus modification protein PilV [Legionella adelaidensis]KTC65514.1 pre-pilin leader sequence (pilV) [Legionella adelaidensis]VEH84665.1 pre-pilin leader sequence (pilV) [Legionella adelaidensis]